ncbi:MAG: family 10 glycosylhydrolase, partial [Planctomycetales bacterium]|nr:family 10 glycosylhydrolase [Planctomycetales bacterium]
NDADGNAIPFPDDATYEAAVAAGETLDRDDWRRQNVDRFVERLYRQTKAAKPSVQVGISPFGIWRPGHPAGVVGFDQYASLYADARKWLQEGWVDYFSPQLYWSVDSKGQSFPALLAWWHEQNVKQKQLWPGLFTSRIADGSQRSWKADEIVRQIQAVRAADSPGGHIHFSMKAIQANRDGIRDRLKNEIYATEKAPADSATSQ